jgi:hypothetical protein
MLQKFRGTRRSAHVEPLIERQDLERLICQHYQWAIDLLMRALCGSGVAF